MDVATEQVNLTDDMLVALAKEGDRTAFGELAQRHHQRSVNLATLFLKNRGDAEDETQNAFSNAFERIGQFNGEAEFSTWLSRIVANQCLMLMRTRRRARFVYLDEPVSRDRSQAVELPGSGPDPEGEMACSQMMSAIHVEIRRIPALLRNVMVLRDIQELPMSQVAGQLGITVPAAKSRLLRARIELGARLRHHFKGNGASDALSRTAAPLNRVVHRRTFQVL